MKSLRRLTCLGWDWLWEGGGWGLKTASQSTNQLSGKDEESKANKDLVKKLVAKKRIAFDSSAQEKEKIQKFPRPQFSISIGRVANERGWSSQLLG